MNEGPVRVFSCFDPRHDADLHARLVSRSEAAQSPVRVVDGSRAELWLAGWESSLRDRIASVDLVLVSCGEHTGTSLGMNAELRITQELDKPYLLLRGRREAGWTQPECARAGDLVYTWDWPLILSRIGVVLRRRTSTA